METKKEFYETTLGKKLVMQLTISGVVSIISIIVLVVMYIGAAGKHDDFIAVMENETGVVAVAIITFLLLLLTSHFEGKIAGAIAQFKEQ